jgi:hypothetical protein
LILYLLVGFSVFHAPQMSTRYFYFVYPVLLTLVAMAVSDGAGLVLSRLDRERWPRTALSILLFMVFFAASEDFQPRHIIGVSGREANFRLGEFERYEPVWYWRYDYASPGRFASEATGSNDDEPRLIVVDQPPVSYYVERAHAIYIPRETQKFRGVSRVRGTVHLWSNQRLLSTFDEVREYTHSAQDVWLVRFRDPRRDPTGPRRRFLSEYWAPPFPEGEIWGDRLVTADRKFIGEDGRIEVVSIRLHPPESRP